MGALFGPAGNSEAFYQAGKKHTLEAPAWLKEVGLDAYEYQCGNGVVGSETTFLAIGKAAKEHNIRMSVHAPYYISLSGVDKEKRLKSVEYVEKTLRAAVCLGADTIVIHAGSAAKITRDEAMSLALDTLSHILEAAQKPECGGGSIRMGLETMGKKNQLGTLEEILVLCKLDESFVPVVDFGHLNARDCGGVFQHKEDYRRVFHCIADALSAEVAEHLHCHFSKIEYTSAGEKKHLTFADEVFGPSYEPLMEAIYQEGLSPRIICESSGTQADDACKMKAYYQGLKA